MCSAVGSLLYMYDNITRNLARYTGSGAGCLSWPQKKISTTVEFIRTVTFATFRVIIVPGS